MAGFMATIEELSDNMRRCHGKVDELENQLSDQDRDYARNDDWKH